jgi:hypothetical protein
VASLLSPQADFNFIWRQCFYSNIQSVPCRQAYGHKPSLPRQKNIYMGEIWWLDFGKKQNFRQNLNQCQLSFLVTLCVHGRERGRKIWMSKRTCKVFNLFKTYPLVFLLSHFAWIFLWLNWLQIVLTCMCKKERDMRERTCKNFQPL